MSLEVEVEGVKEVKGVEGVEGEAQELIVPVIIKNVRIDTPLGQLEKVDRHYFNVIVQDLHAIRYVPGPREGNYIRQKSVIRYYNEDVCWPDHPLSISGQIQGAISIIRSTDNRILLVRNRNLWGLPKGARNYREFLRLKGLTEDHYLKTGKILEHPQASFTYDDSETSVENLCREVKEETGITIDKSRLAPFKYRNSSSYCAYDGYFYDYPRTAAEHIIDLDANGTDHENDELLWVTHEKLQDLLHDHLRSRVFNHVTFGYLDEYAHRK
jgi:8-oxo-dGTP pyrophosphatase MutT (NUDIX family)